MAMFSGDVHSQCLRLRTGVEVCFPADENVNLTEPPRAVIYFLHGLTEDFRSFGQWTLVPWLSRKYHFVAVMPDAGRSRYMNGATGPYLDYIAKELRPLLEKMFVLPKTTFLIGNSMGGYGAMKALLSAPDIFAGAAGLSGAYDVDRVIENHHELGAEFDALLAGEKQVPKDENVFELVKKNPPFGKKLYITCGLSDPYLPDSKRLEALLSEVNVPYKAVYGAGGHDWDYWNAHLEEAVRMLLSEDKEER